LQVPAYVPAHIKDLTTLRFCVASLQAHPQISTVTVVAARDLERHCHEMGVGFLDELELAVPWYTDDPEGRRRWYYQMVLKMSIASMDDAPDRYLTVDADGVFLNPFRLLDEDADQWLYPRMTERHPQYYVGIEHLLGRTVEYDGSYIAHLVMWRSALVREMFEEFARVAGRPPGEGGDVLREYLETCDRDTRWFSEPDTYGHFARERSPGELRWADRRQLNVLYVRPSERVLARLRPYYDYCNFHAYRQSDRLWLRTAGAVWLAQRLLRDRLNPKARRSPDLATG
jgi:hypothetical protein